MGAGQHRTPRLTLRLLGGLEVPEIARAYLVPKATIVQRIVRTFLQNRRSRLAS